MRGRAHSLYIITKKHKVYYAPLAQLMCLPGIVADCVMQQELVLVETVRADGSSAQVLFKLDGQVTAAALERLCVKVSVGRLCNW